MSNDEPKLTIFISSMIGPLWVERAAVEEAIRTGIPLARPWVFERAPASSEEITESYLARVRECDIYLLILGDDISDPVKAEHRTAVECDKPRLCLVQEGVECTPALEEFLSTLQADVKYATFRDKASLRREVLRAVRLELVEGYRRYRLGEAERTQLMASIRSDLLSELVEWKLIHSDSQKLLSALNVPVGYLKSLRDVPNPHILDIAGDTWQELCIPKMRSVDRWNLQYAHTSELDSLREQVSSHDEITRQLRPTDVRDLELESLYSRLLELKGILWEVLTAADEKIKASVEALQRFGV